MKPESRAGPCLEERGDEDIRALAAVEIPGAQEMIEIRVLFQTVRDDLGDVMGQAWRGPAALRRQEGLGGRRRQVAPSIGRGIARMIPTRDRDLAIGRQRLLFTQRYVPTYYDDAPHAFLRCAEGQSFQRLNPELPSPTFEEITVIAITIRRATREDAETLLALIEALADYERLDPPDAAASARLIEDGFGARPRFEAYSRSRTAPPSATRSSSRAIPASSRAPPSTWKTSSSAPSRDAAAPAPRCCASSRRKRSPAAAGAWNGSSSTGTSWPRAPTAAWARSSSTNGASAASTARRCREWRTRRLLIPATQACFPSDESLGYSRSPLRGWAAPAAIGAHCEEAHVSRQQLLHARSLEDRGRRACEGRGAIGAVVVLDGRIIAAAHTAEQAEQRMLVHAELLALEAADRLRPFPGRRRDVKLFTNLEPCLMCLGAAMSFFLGEIYYGLEAPGDGAVALVQHWQRDEDVFPAYRVPRIEGGILRLESIELLQEYRARHTRVPVWEWTKALLDRVT